MVCASDQRLADAIRFRREGRHGEAEAIYRQVISGEPGNARACQLLGAALYETGRTDEAVAWLRRAVELEPASASFRCNLAAGLGMLGRHADADAERELRVYFRPVDLPRYAGSRRMRFDSL